MIVLDTNVLVRYLVDDDAEQAQAARTLLEGLTSERPGFVCREVMVELVWVLQRAYGLSRDRIAAVLEALVAAEGLQIEAADVARAAFRYRRGGAGFSDLMIAAAAERSGASPLQQSGFHREIERNHVVPGDRRQRRRANGEGPAAPAMIDYDKFRRSLKELKEQYTNYRNPVASRSDLDQEGIAESVIQRFETCYDCLWKVRKRYLIEALGIADPPNSPKPIFRLAHENHLFSASMERWLLYADKRNATAHAYDGEKVKARLEVMPDFIDDAIGLYQTMSGETWQ